MNNPFAFPSQALGSDGNPCEEPGYGMTLRDYFAIHCDQPGQMEIIAEAGIAVSDYSGLRHDDPERAKLPTFTSWWMSLPQAERFRLYAKVRYGLADAMIAQRGPQSGESK